MLKHSVLIQWSEEDNGYIAIVPELPGLSAFGSSAEEAIQELSVAKEAYLEVLKEDGEQIPEPDLLKPFSGQTRLRLPKSLHASLSFEAKKEGVSLNSYIVHLLSERNSYRQMRETIAKLKDRIDKLMLVYPSPEVKTEMGIKDFTIGTDTGGKIIKLPNVGME